MKTSKTNPIKERRESNVENYLLPNLLADKILSSAATVRSADLEGGRNLDKSPPSTLGVDPPEPLDLLSNFNDTE